MAKTYRIVYSTPPSPIEWFYNPSDDDCGGQVAVNNIKGKIVLPLGATLEEGWNLHIRQDVGPGGPTINVQYPDSIMAQMGSESFVYCGEGLSEIVRGGPNKIGGYIYTVGGNIFNTGSTLTNGE